MSERRVDRHRARIGSARPGVVFLCGPQSRYVTATTLMLDGGRSYR